MEANEICYWHLHAGEFYSANSARHGASRIPKAQLVAEIESYVVGADAK